MSETAVLRAPLGDVFATPRADGAAGVQAAEWAGLACIVLRGHADDAAFTTATQSTLGVALPAQPSTYAAGGRRIVLWMSPDEWWLLLPHADRDAVMAALTSALQGVFAQIADNSGTLTCLRLAGPEHVTLLRHLSPYDFERMAVGRCVSSVIPKAGVTVVRSYDAGVMLIFRRSFADWVWRLIERSAKPYGLALCTPAQLPAADFSTLLEGSAHGHAA